ncbi:hypothetical protein B566_EDAN010013 [Ephemera danica]|nr:hypothetical protein B566_EDAN010013 [Ephemera danica]
MVRVGKGRMNKIVKPQFHKIRKTSTKNVKSTRIEAIKQQVAAMATNTATSASSASHNSVHTMNKMTKSVTNYESQGQASVQHSPIIAANLAKTAKRPRVLDLIEAPVKAKGLSQTSINSMLTTDESPKVRKKTTASTVNAKRTLDFQNIIQVQEENQKITFGAKSKGHAERREFPVPVKFKVNSTSKETDLNALKPVNVQPSDVAPTSAKNSESAEASENGTSSRTTNAPMTATNGAENSFADSCFEEGDEGEMVPVHPSFPEIIISSRKKVDALLRSHDKGGAFYARRLFKALFTDEEILQMSAQGTEGKRVPKDVLNAVDLGAIMTVQHFSPF